MNTIQEYASRDWNGDTDLRLLEQYARLCWQGRLHYQAEKNKLLYWLGTVVVALVGATGVVNVGTGQPFVQLTFIHCIMFHFLFAIVYFYFLYKQFRIMQYDLHRKLAEQEIRKRLGTPTFSYFQQLVSHDTECASASVRWLVKIPNILMVIIYLCVSIIPVTQIGLSGGMLRMAWQGVASLLLGMLILLVGRFLYRNARDRLRNHHSRDLEQHDQGIVACVWPRRPT